MTTTTRHIKDAAAGAITAEVTTKIGMDRTAYAKDIEGSAVVHTALTLTYNGKTEAAAPGRLPPSMHKGDITHFVGRSGGIMVGLTEDQYNDLIKWIDDCRAADETDETRSYAAAKAAKAAEMDEVERAADEMNRIMRQD